MNLQYTGQCKEVKNLNQRKTRGQSLEGPRVPTQLLR